MQPNRNPAYQPKSYDPSAPYRARMMRPPPPAVITRIPSNNPYSSQDIPVTNIDPKTGVVKQIPQFYYPRYDDDDDEPPIRPNFVDPREIQPNLPPPVVQQPVPQGYLPYSHPYPLPVDQYAPDQYYPYPSPYFMPITTNLPPEEPSKSDVIAEHQKDSDLSRLEVYHFTPKQNTSLSMKTGAAPPIVQYHVYPYPPAPGAPGPPIPPQQPPQQEFPPYPHSWHSYPPNGPPYAPESSQPVLSYIDTIARGSQTEEPTTKSRGISPIHFSNAVPIYDDDGYPYIHQKSLHTDRHNITTGRINRPFYDNNRSTPIADCRCLDCQRERSKLLNYYPD